MSILKAASDNPSDLVVVGRISGIFGVRGWVKVYSYTHPLENILVYNPWQVRSNLVGEEWRPMNVQGGRPHGKGIVAQLEGFSDPESARTLLGADIAVCQNQLPPPRSGQYYWRDLVGLAVETLDGVALGTVDHLLETGANDVLVVMGDRERLLPYIDQVVVEVDLHEKRMRVDWDPEF